MLKNVQHYQEKLKKRQMKQKMREEIDKNSDYNDTGLDELGNVINFSLFLSINALFCPVLIVEL